MSYPLSLITRQASNGQTIRVRITWKGSVVWELDGVECDAVRKLPAPITRDGKVYTHACENVAILESEMAAVESARKDWRSTLQGYRAQLCQAVAAYGHPMQGTGAWEHQQRAQEKLDVFDVAYPEILARWRLPED